ncbi:MAG: NAD+ synthase [Alphaproteobacteria bacterium]|nr:NAD+ synthase [Alphaproteobacteria bacterium]
MKTTLTIALGQMNPIVGDLPRNCQKILDVWSAQEQDIDLIVFPELSLCGYPPEDLVLKPFFLDQIEKYLWLLAEQSRNFKSAALVGCPWRQDGSLYNAMHLIEGGEIKATRFKHHLPAYGVFDESRVFAAGLLPSPMDFRGRKVGIMICEDMWFPPVAAHLKAQGAEILLVANASPFDVSKPSRRLFQARSRATETALSILYVNQIGGQDELVFDGGSFAMDSQGGVVSNSPFFTEHTLQVVLQADGELKTLSSLGNSLPDSAADDIEDPAVGLSLSYGALVLGLKDYVEKNGFPGILIGLSGGVDSALASVLAVDALGAARVRGVMMPSRYTAPESLEDAAALAKNLGMALETIPLEPVLPALHEAVAPHIQGSSLAFENIQARARGLILMALSNAGGAMVLSTGNKSEMAVGYATLYGDMCGGFNVLKDVYKTQVYALCHWRNGTQPVIPARILLRPPTAELRENQKDQDTLPPYEMLDAILHGLIEEDLGPQDLIARGFEAGTVREVWRMLDRAEYKRRQAPPGPKITARAFGRERRYPITNGFRRVLDG